MFWSLFIFRGDSTRELPVSVVCNDEQGDLFYSAGPHRNRYQPELTQEKLGRGFGKNAGEWTRRVQISKEEIPGKKRSMFGYILTYSRLERENV